MDSIPVFTVEVRVELSEQEVLEQLLISFAEQHNFTVEDFGRKSALAEGRRVSGLQFSRADTIQMALGDYLDGKRFWIAIYDDRGTDNWQDLSEELLETLLSRWPSTEVKHRKLKQ